MSSDEKPKHLKYLFYSLKWGWETRDTHESKSKTYISYIKLKLTWCYISWEFTPYGAISLAWGN